MALTVRQDCLGGITQYIFRKVLCVTLSSLCKGLKFQFEENGQKEATTIKELRK